MDELTKFLIFVAGVLAYLVAGVTITALLYRYSPKSYLPDSDDGDESPLGIIVLWPMVLIFGGLFAAAHLADKLGKWATSLRPHEPDEVLSECNELLKKAEELEKEGTDGVDSKASVPDIRA
jgi:hypothetical protein